MAHVTLLTMPASAFIPDQNAQLVAGDVGASWVSHKDRPALSFDDTAEEAVVSPEYSMPGQYAGGTLKATGFIYAADDNSNGCVFDFFIEAITPLDTLDLEAAVSWDAANSSGDIDLNGTTVGDLIAFTVTLTNKDSIAAGDLFRLGVRRDTDHANDDASGDIYLSSVEIWEDT